MDPKDRRNLKNISLEHYRELESEMHTELMGICRRYVSQLGLVSLMGILDVVKQETQELEQHTKKSYELYDDNEKPKNKAKESSFF